MGYRNALLLGFTGATEILYNVDPERNIGTREEISNPGLEVVAVEENIVWFVRFHKSPRAYSFPGVFFTQRKRDEQTMA